ncbi:MAG: hypothetical protein MJ245_00060 [Clostridia bacterium]|nr:hypothetical protein [Clostridia bacterium]
MGNNVRNNQSQNVQETKQIPTMVYGFAKKGYVFEQEGKYDRQTQDILDENGNVLKPASSNTAVLVCDTGNAYIKGVCYDHHQLSQECKEKYPSATSMISRSAKEIFEAHKDDKRLQLVCHDNPDTDAILSITLARLIIENGGNHIVGEKQIVDCANAADTFTFKTGFNYGTLLAKYIKEEFPQKGSLMQKKEAIEHCSDFVEETILELSRMMKEEPDEEKRKAITLDDVADSITAKYSRFYKSFNKEGIKIQKYRKEIIEQDERDKVNFKECMKNKTTLKQRDEVAGYKDMDIRGGNLGYDEFDINLVKRQLTKEDREKDFETSETPSKVFVYTGTKNPSAGICAKAREQYDVTIIPTYDNLKHDVTIKISSSRDDIDLGHFGRYIESIIYKENLNQANSTIKDKDEFKLVRDTFIDRLKPLDKGNEGKHFTGYEALCGNDPKFFGFRVSDKSTLYSLENIKGYMEDYFADPQKIKRADFEEIIGKDTLDEIGKIKNPEAYGIVKPRKKIIIAGSDKQFTQRSTKPIYKERPTRESRDEGKETTPIIKEEVKEEKIEKDEIINEEIINTIAESNLSEEEQNEILNEILDEQEKLEEEVEVENERFEKGLDRVNEEQGDELDTIEQE